MRYLVCRNLSAAGTLGPHLLSARTWMVYTCPFTRPVLVAILVSFTLDQVDQVLPLFDDQRTW